MKHIIVIVYIIYNNSIFILLYQKITHHISLVVKSKIFAKLKCFWPLSLIEIVCLNEPKSNLGNDLVELFSLYSISINIISPHICNQKLITNSTRCILRSHSLFNILISCWLSLDYLHISKSLCSLHLVLYIQYKF